MKLDQPKSESAHRQVWQPQPRPCYDQDGRTIEVHDLVEGIGLPKFIGIVECQKPGFEPAKLRFEIPAATRLEAFEKFDQSMHAMVDQINEAERKEKIKRDILNAAAESARPNVRKRILADA